VNISPNSIATFRLENVQGSRSHVKGARVWGHRQLDEHFIDCVINKKKPQVTAEDGIIAVEIAKNIVKEQHSSRQS